MNDNLFKSLKKNALLVHRKFGTIGTNDEAFDNIEAMNVILKSNPKLSKQYKQAIHQIANNLSLYKPILDIMGIITFTELYATNKLQLARLILIEVLISQLTPEDYQNKTVIIERLSAFLTESTENDALLSNVFSRHMAITNNEYQVILETHR